MSVAPENAVTTDPRLVEVTRLSNRGDVLQGRKLYPDGLEAKGAEDKVADHDNGVWTTVIVQCLHQGLLSSMNST